LHVRNLPRFLNLYNLHNLHNRHNPTIMKLSVGELEILFEGRTRFVERLAQHKHPLTVARQVLQELPESELLEALNAHPRIGERGGSAISTGEQGTDEDPEAGRELARLNRLYEGKFGFRFVVFVNGRPRSEIVKVLWQRLRRSKDEELATAIDDLVSIAEDRYRRGIPKQNGGRR
ncbi:MAG: 2-oxo-4-hydroxy-4-carboxy-5-ureidoimidazoline decarboxylase, partial [Vicinamibacterales bacterium]